MHNSTVEQVPFDLLVKGQVSVKEATLGNIDQLRPRSDHIEQCRRWLLSQGVACYATDFGLAGSAPPTLFESVFSCTLKRTDAAPGLPSWESSPAPQAPSVIADIVEQITISAEPEQF